MKYGNHGDYYISDIVGEKSGRIDNYCFKEDMIWLQLLLEQAANRFQKLLVQYPTALDEEIIFELMDRSYQEAKRLGKNPEFCYHYFGTTQGTRQGISIETFDSVGDIGLFLVRMTTNFGTMIQEKANFIYDAEESCLIPKKVAEIQNCNGLAVMESFSPKSLRKLKKYIL